jgi:hypothetical protein
MPNCTHCKSLSSTQRCQNAPCGHCAETLALPPSVSFLLTHFPHITPNYPLDRTKPRCQHCDLVAAHKRVIDAENPPPTYENPVKTIKGHLDGAVELIAKGERVAELEPLLPYMRRALADATELRDRRADDAWMEYWGIWGKGKVEIEE